MPLQELIVHATDQVVNDYSDPSSQPVERDAPGSPGNLPLHKNQRQNPGDLSPVPTGAPALVGLMYHIAS